MKQVNVAAENHLMQDELDPFKIFDLKYDFDIRNLDEIYYKFYKKDQNLDIINAAYAILKDDIKKIQFLCRFYKINEKIDLKAIFKLKFLKKEEKEKIQQKYLNLAIENAKLNQWKEAYININYVVYLVN